MEYSMYRVMIGLIDAGQFENGDIIEGMSRYATVVKNPINMINSARFAFDNTIERRPALTAISKSGEFYPVWIHWRMRSAR